MSAKEPVNRQVLLRISALCGMLYGAKEASGRVSQSILSSARIVCNFTSFTAHFCRYTAQIVTGFYDWCEIGSIYGAPADCLWGGGRAGFGECGAREALALAQEYGISARLTFSNSLLREEHLSDRKCNALCELFSQANGVQNGVIVHSELLTDYLRTRYPALYLVSSTTKVLTDF